MLPCPLGLTDNLPLGIDYSSLDILAVTLTPCVTTSKLEVVFQRKLEPTVSTV